MNRDVDTDGVEIDAAGGGTQGLQGVSRALRTLLLFRSERELGVRQIARMLDVNPAAAFRIVITLTEQGFLEQLPGSKTYTLGHSMAELAQGFSRSQGFSQVALSLMTPLHAHTGETIGLHVLRNGLRTCLLTLESPQALRMVVPAGSVLHITNGATDLVMHAFSSPVERAKILQALAQPSWTENEAGLLGTQDHNLPDEDVITEVRSKGWAASFGTRTPGSAAVAVPVQLGSVLYALSVFGPQERIQALGVAALAAELEQVATTMTVALAALRPAVLPEHGASFVD